MRDEEIISLILKGKTHLFAQILERYQSKVYSTVYHYTQSQEEAKDITQEIFIKVYNSLAGYKSKASFSTWLYRIAVNRCIDWTRKKRLPTISVVGDGTEDETDILDLVADDGNNPEDLMLRQENAGLIREAVKALPEIYRTVIVLYYFESFNPQEISDITDTPKRTIETRLYRAKGLLKQNLKELLYGGEGYGLQQV